MSKSRSLVVDRDEVPRKRGENSGVAGIWTIGGVEGARRNGTPEPSRRKGEKATSVSKVKEEKG